MLEHKICGPYDRWIKRTGDILCAMIVIVLFWWVYGILAILVRIKLGSPVLFAQDRPGMIDRKTGKERIFKLYKFRTMTDTRDENGKLLPDNVRLTKFGRFLRATSLDELPEFWNILIGDMSLIGPRPLALEYIHCYTKQERVRHTVRPGLTGLAQANGRNGLSWSEKFAYDVEYANNITFLMDCKVILKTVKAVLFREGIGQGEERPTSLHVERADWQQTPEGAIPPPTAAAGAKGTVSANDV